MLYYLSYTFIGGHKTWRVSKDTSADDGFPIGGIGAIVVCCICLILIGVLAVISRKKIKTIVKGNNKKWRDKHTLVIKIEPMERKRRSSVFSHKNIINTPMI